MTLFRPCIDLHDGKVKQIVGGTLRDDGSSPRENFVADDSPAWFAARYRSDSLSGGHVIKLGPGNDSAAAEALAAYPEGLQIGGGITIENAGAWLDAGASHVIVTSWLFDQEGRFQRDRLKQLSARVGRQRLVLDLSCRRIESDQGPQWRVAMNRWQKLTDLPVTASTLDSFLDDADQLLIHAADVEGLCGGIDAELAELMGRWGKLPMTYAGGTRSLDDVRLVRDASDGRVDVTVGSALDLFGGTGVAYQDLLKWNRQQIGDPNR